MSRDTGRCDVENLLLYNVGPSCFAAAARVGVRFERRFGDPPATEGVAPSPDFHYWRYEFAPADGPFECWRAERSLVRWHGVPCPRVSSASRPDAVWWALKGHAGRLEVSRARSICHPGWFGVRLPLHVPRGTELNLVALVKPLFDGVVAAFHCWPDPQGEQAQRLSRSLHADPSEVRAALADCSLAVLGKRRLLFQRGSGVH